MACIFAVGMTACATDNGIPIESAAGPVHFVKYKDKTGECRWTLYSSNYKNIARSSKGYSSNSACNRSIELARGAAYAELIEKD